MDDTQETNSLFLQILDVLNTEDLIRVRHRSKKKDRAELVGFLTDEIKRREKIWRSDKK